MAMNVILYTSATNTSGGAHQALYLAQGLTDRGHCVRFFVPPHATPPTRRAEGAYRPEKRMALVENIYTQLLHKKGLL